jgi:hypothetical protein
VIGLLSDSGGDLEAFDAAYELLRGRGAKRFFFLGGGYGDLDGWIRMRKDRAKVGGGAGEDAFLADVTRWLSEHTREGQPPPDADDWNPDNIREKFIRTPEKGCPEYADPTVQRKVVDMIGDALCCLVHDKNDLDRDDLLNASVFVHGSSNEAKVVQIGPRFFVTPGRLSGSGKKTCALLDDLDRHLVFSAFALDGSAMVDRQPLVAGGKTKLSVK